LCIARAEHLPATAGQQILVFVTAAPIQHANTFFHNLRLSDLSETDPSSHGSAPNYPRPALILDARTPRGIRPLPEWVHRVGPLSIIAPLGGKASLSGKFAASGVNSRLQLRFILVATNLHLRRILLIFR
jgi:hypothetical protein